ncbi:MAG: uroporphyrinogen decarboxylase [Crocinitomicaceae bacterium]|nr:uroporphyrinogen decarboxylase [Crocinitomicaceae bacterium]
MELNDVIGYLAMGFVLLSFIMKQVKMLRIINTIGCFLFIIHGFLLIPINWPIVATNIAIVLINVYYLYFVKNNKSS